jgi:hypothetical protein
VGPQRPAAAAPILIATLISAYINKRAARTQGKKQIKAAAMKVAAAPRGEAEDKRR